jgi:hypothetical protein
MIRTIAGTLSLTALITGGLAWRVGARSQVDLLQEQVTGIAVHAEAIKDKQALLRELQSGMPPSAYHEKTQGLRNSLAAHQDFLVAYALSPEFDSYADRVSAMAATVTLGKILFVAGLIGGLIIYGAATNKSANNHMENNKYS